MLERLPTVLITVKPRQKICSLTKPKSHATVPPKAKKGKA